VGRELKVAYVLERIGYSPEQLTAIEFKVTLPE